MDHRVKKVIELKAKMAKLSGKTIKRKTSYKATKKNPGEYAVIHKRQPKLSPNS